jgi:hypothetical protein
MRPVVLEKAAQEFADATAQSPPLYELTPTESSTARRRRVIAPA